MATVMVAVASVAVSVIPARAQTPLDRFYHQRVAWTSCGDKELDARGALCAAVMVPLDYADPGGRTITLAISRLAAADPAHRIGDLVVNPGGPGAPALKFGITVRDRLAPDVRARYDVIGMDPRGIGRSTPVNCAWKAPTVITAAGFDVTSFARDVAYSGAIAASCLAADNHVRYITTRNTARDMDIVRGILGDATLNYYGASYGTYLGAVFTQLFPDRVGRFVLDSAVDPNRYWLGVVADQGPINEAALDDWAAWSAARDNIYHFGGTAHQVRDTVENLLHRAARVPIPFAGLPIDEHLAPLMLLALLSDPTANDVLAIGVRNLLDIADGKPEPPLNPRLLFYLRQLQNAAGAGLSAITCGDVAAPRDPAWYWRNIEATRATEPVFGPYAHNIEACAFWPEPIEPPTVVRNAVPALIVQATRDPRTIYAEGLALHRDMAGSRMVTLDKTRIHGVFRPNLSSCVNNAVNSYLRTGILPGDMTCLVD